MTKEKPKPYKEEWLAQWDEKPLSEKRKSLRGVSLMPSQLLDIIQEQDKQALKRLKVAVISYHGQDINKLQEEIDKIFGEELTK